jgi:alanyl-tRNA synthetase
MNSAEIRNRFLKFFEKREHVIIPSASLVTPDEKGVTNSTLFNTAGMQPLVPYLLGKPHPQGTRLVDVQKVLRTVDIDDIGDKTHATFFEMLGNWSLGDYFKQEAINWSYDFLTSKEEGLGLDPNRLYVTVFEGDDNAPRDEEAADIWREIFSRNRIEGNRIFYLPAKNNWWEAGDNGPCGPDTEMYYDVSNKLGGKGLTHEEFMQADDSRTVVEIWNDVFMQYEKKDGKIIGKLPKPSVDTGAGLERLCMTLQGVDNIYDTDLLKPVMDEIVNVSTKWDLRSSRIITDHIRASVFLISDGVIPDSNGRGYILRRLLRRAKYFYNLIGAEHKALGYLAHKVAEIYENQGYKLIDKISEIDKIITQEESDFNVRIQVGNKILDKIIKSENLISAENAFLLYSTYGYPFELISEISKTNNIKIDEQGFYDLKKKHQDLSRAGAEQKFKGGLADTSEMSVKYHTATHLLHQALHDVLGDKVMQKGSNITPERLRFDFAHGSKMTDEEKKKVEDIVNSKIAEALPVNQIIMPKSEAEKTGARHFFGEKYGDEVSIYFIGKDLNSAYSKEFCGGPHVKNTSELGKFKIQKEEASSAGVRRIKAVLQ